MSLHTCHILRLRDRLCAGMNAYPAQKLDADEVRIRMPPANFDCYVFVDTQEILQGKSETVGVPECIGRKLSRRQTKRYTGVYQNAASQRNSSEVS